MFSFLSKTKNLLSWFKEPGSSYERKRVRPSKDWGRIFVSSLIFVLILALVSTYFYIEIDAGRLFVSPEAKIVNETKINTALLKKIVGGIKNRENAFLLIEAGVGIPPDPSI